MGSSRCIAVVPAFKAARLPGLYRGFVTIAPYRDGVIEQPRQVHRAAPQPSRFGGHGVTSGI